MARVPPCPSSWHEDVKREKKFPKMDHISAQLNVNVFYGIFSQKLEEMEFFSMLIYIHNGIIIKIIQDVENGMKCK